MLDDNDYNLIEPEPFDWSSFDLEEFEAWLRTPGVLINGWEIPFWLRAVSHRHAWTCYRALDYQSPKDMVKSHIDIMNGCCAWVSPDGMVFPVNYSAHDPVAEVIIGKPVGEIETTYARVSILGRALENFFAFVEQPTPKQRKATREYVTQNIAHFRYLKDWS